MKQFIKMNYNYNQSYLKNKQRYIIVVKNTYKK